MPDPILLYGTRADGSQAPVAIDSAGRVRINGLGEKGDPGEPGPPGPPGEGGEAGGPGAAASVAVGNVTTGAAGSAASVSNTGTAYEAVFDFAIPRGDKGEPGDPGPQGDPGSKGDKGDTGSPFTPSTFTYDSSGNIALAGRWTQSTNGAASASAHSITGSWFTGGTSTTTKPQFLIEQAGATSNNWSVLGTGMGVNAPSGFAGNLADLQVNATSRFKVSSGGRVTASEYYLGSNSGLASFSDSPLIVTGGTFPVMFSSVGMRLSDGYAIAWQPTGSQSYQGVSDLVIVRDSADTLGQRNGTRGQTSRIYNTYASATNYERFNIRWVANELVLDTEAGSNGGTLRGIKLGSAASLLGFYDATPVVRPAAVADATDAATAISQLNAVLARLRTLGLIAT